MEQTIKTTCPYCGVGCGVTASRNEQGEWRVSGDKEHPANFGRLCSKGAALAQTIDHQGRLLHPVVEGAKASWSTAIDMVARQFNRVIEQHGPDAVAFYVSGQILTEDYYVANKLMKGFIGSANIDTNSRLCMASSVAGHKRAFGSDTVPCSYEDLERANMIVLTGSNTAWCHPVLFQRIRQAKKDNPSLYIVVIDPRRTATCDIADLHLPLKAGSDTVLFNGLFAYLHQQGEENRLFTQNCTQGLTAALDMAVQSAGDISTVAEQCGLPQDQVLTFYKRFARIERVVTVYSQGVNQSSAGTDKVNAIINCHLLTGRIGRPGMGPFSFTGQPNAMGGREVGGLANQLAAHMEIDNENHRQLVQQFWQSPVIAAQQGYKAVDLFNAIHEGKVKALWVMGTNPVVSLPNTNHAREALARCEFVAVSDCVQHTDTTEYAHVLLPATTWGEKDGTVTNSERRISRQRPFLQPPGQARHDWWIICEVAKAMGYGDAFSYEGPDEIFREHAALSGIDNQGSRDFDISAMQQLTRPQYDDLLPLQWPVREKSDNDRQTVNHPNNERMFADGRFFTPNGKARFIAIEPRAPVNAPDAEFPLILNTGRLRDQWHTMTRTGKTARLTSHEPEPFVAIHPRDAATYKVSDGALVEITSQWGTAIVQARVSDEQQPGTIFVPMHWNRQFASDANVGALINPALDPVSGQPEFKHTPVAIKPRAFSWRGFLLSRRELPTQDVRFWVKVTGEGIKRYEMAGDSHPGDWAQWSRQLLCQSDHNINWVEYFDGKSNYRGARLIGDQLESCIFISATGNLPSRQWLASLLDQEMLSDSDRASLLSGRPAAEQADIGHIVCACFAVGEQQILDAINKKGCASVQCIGEQLQAGTNCGSCIPELEVLLKTANPATATN
ncbi:MAG: molybdopterin-dependent oxidoreductase [Gammaproteobacteria bacterium]|jgi:assimilatory nitrate reductase catalytic subunit